MLCENVLQELGDAFRRVDRDQVASLADEVRLARRVVLHGKGRMGLILRAFALELRTLGLDARWLGEVTAPRIGPGDLLVVTPTAGALNASRRFVDTALKAGARVAAFTANPGGEIGALASTLVSVRARTMAPGDNTPSVQPMCSTLEQTGLLLFDWVCAVLCGADTSRAGNVLWREVERGVREVSDEALAGLIARTDGAARVFFDGPPREKTLLSCYAMRVHHMGRTVCVAGEVTDDVPGPGDVLVASCGAADPHMLRRMADARRGGAFVMALTSVPEDPALTACCDETVYLPGAQPEWGSAQRPGLAYGQTMLISLDRAVAETMRLHGWRESDLAVRHTNLE